MTTATMELVDEFVTKVCAECEAEFVVDTSQCAWWSQKYCSEDCRKRRNSKYGCNMRKTRKETLPAHTRGVVVLTCEWCQEDFVVPGEKRDQRFCSKPKKCMYEAQRGDTPSKQGALNKGVKGSYRMSEEVKGKVSQSILDGYRNGRQPNVPRHQRHLYESSGRKVLMRSNPEVIFAQSLDALGIEWQYEPKKFDLGWATYTPDFYLPTLNKWVEVKGFWTDRSLRKFTEFQQTHRASAVLAKDLLQLARKSGNGRSFPDQKEGVMPW